MIGFILHEIETEEDRDFILQIYNTYQKYMAAVIYNVTHDPQSIPDIIQTTILKLIPHIVPFPEK